MSADKDTRMPSHSLFGVFRRRDRMPSPAVLLFSAIVWGSLGCQGENSVQPEVRDASTLLWTLDANHNAVILSIHKPYDTVQLAAAPRNVYGDVISTEAPLEFRKLVAVDTSVRIDANGLVTAITPITSVRVEVSLTIGRIRRSDTVTIMVRDESPIRKIGALDFQPLESDSSWLWAGEPPLTTYDMDRWVQVYDTAGVQIPNSEIVVSYTWDNNAVVGCEYICIGGSVGNTGGLIGESYIRAEVYAYGKVLVDSLLFKRVDPTAKQVAIRSIHSIDGSETIALYPPELSVRQGTTVIFLNLGVDSARSGGVGNLRKRKRFSGTELLYVDPVDIVFDDSLRVMPGDSFGFLTQFSWAFDLLSDWSFISDGRSGNIEAFGYKMCDVTTPRIPNHDGCGGLGLGELDVGWRSRKFVEPGTYHYGSSRYPGVRGTIIVRDF